MKFSALLLILIFPIIIACSNSDDSTYAYNEESQINLDKIYEAQAKKADEQQAETERQLEKAAEQLERADAQAERMEKLLKRWEKQADRYDAILDKWENTNKP